MTGKLRDAIRELISYSSLVGELNHYFDAEKCSIGWHGDEERKIAVGARFGYGANEFPLKFHAHHSTSPTRPLHTSQTTATSRTRKRDRRGHLTGSHDRSSCTL